MDDPSSSLFLVRKKKAPNGLENDFFCDFVISIRCTLIHAGNRLQRNAVEHA